MLGADFTLPGSLVKDPRLDYTALGHIHKKQDLNPGKQPPVVYPGSIERVDFGEAADEKYFVVAHIEKKNTRVEFRQFTGIRTFIDRSVKLTDRENVTESLIAEISPRERLKDAVVRLVAEYPRGFEPLIDETAIREHAKEAFEFHFIRKPSMGNRVRLADDQQIASLTPVELTGIYWSLHHTPEKEVTHLQKLVSEIISEAHDMTDGPIEADNRTA
jgi:exonuclease SbcD